MADCMSYNVFVHCFRSSSQKNLTLYSKKNNYHLKMATIFGPYYLGFVACQRTVNNKEINLKHSQIAETREYGEK